MRSREFIPQLREPKYGTPKQIWWGLTLVVIGLFEKTVVADTIFSPIVDLVYQPDLHPGRWDIIVATLAFSGQLFCDFAGYSTCAIGVALCLGFTLITNFRFPYAAQGFFDFWNRWHISLSTWLRDYLFTSLGGIYRHNKLRTFINLMITMLLCGLWHGPSWNFVLWGGIHGIYLAVEIGWRLIVGRRKIPHAWYVTLGSMLLTFSLFSFTLIFFRADNSFAAIDLVSQILNNDAGNNPSLLSTWQIQTTLVAVFAMLAIHMLMRDIELEALFLKVPKVVHLLLVLAMILVMILAGGSSKVFIYFQF